jgi:thioredoxin-related protein
MKNVASIFTMIAFIFLLSSCKKKVAVTPLSDYKVTVIDENWDQTLLKAQTKDKNICLMFHASWCNICKTFIADVLTNTNVANTINNKIIVGLIDGDKTYGKPYFNQFNGDSFPTFLILDKNGQEISRRKGGMNNTEFLNWINTYLK